jgi:hypothetical protein
LNDYIRLGGHANAVRSIQDVVEKDRHRIIEWHDKTNPWPLGRKPMLA